MMVIMVIMMMIMVVTINEHKIPSWYIPLPAPFPFGLDSVNVILNAWTGSWMRFWHLDIGVKASFVFRADAGGLVCCQEQTLCRGEDGEQYQVCLALSSGKNCQLKKTKGEENTSERLTLLEFKFYCHDEPAPASCCCCSTRNLFCPCLPFNNILTSVSSHQNTCGHKCVKFSVPSLWAMTND